MVVTGPQMVIGCRFMAMGYTPVDHSAIARRAPSGVRVHPLHQVILAQYVVDSAIQTSGLGAHSAALIGIDLGDDSVDEPGATPPRMWVGAIVSTPVVQEFLAGRGIPTMLGTTTVEFRGERVVALTVIDEVPVVRTVATVGSPTIVETGDRVYVRQDATAVYEERHPWIATVTDSWALTSLEFMNPPEIFAELAPAEETHAAWGLYAPNASFCHPAINRPAGEETAAAPDPWAGRFSR